MLSKGGWEMCTALCFPSCSFIQDLPFEEAFILQAARINAGIAVELQRNPPAARKASQLEDIHGELRALPTGPVTAGSIMEHNRLLIHSSSNGHGMRNVSIDRACLFAEDKISHAAHNAGLMRRSPPPPGALP